MNEPSTASLAQNVTWTVSNLCRGKPVPELDVVKVFIDPLVHILDIANEDPSACETSDIRTDTVWALSYLSDGDEDRIQAVVNSGAVPTLIKMVKNNSTDRTFMIPTIRCLGNFVTGTDTQTDAVLRAGFLDYAMDLLDHQSKAIKKDTCWILSNIAAGTKDQINALFQNFESNALVAKLVKCAFDAPWDIRKEAVWAICNILTCGTDRHMECVVSVNGIQALCNVLQNQSDATLLLAVMDAFEKLLDADEKYERNYQVMMDECGGVDHLEELQQHPNNDVFEKASNIILLYFGEARDDEDQNLAPATEDATFTFGMPSSASKELFPSGHNASKVSFNFGGSSFNNIAEV
jgi:importin subunit alpha-1